KYGISVDSVARTIGLQNGDMITAIDGKPVDRFEHIISDIVLDQGKTIQVMRNGQPVNIDVKAGTIHSIIVGEKNSFISPRIPVIVDNVSKGTEADKMGLKSGDSIIALNGMSVRFFD